MLIGNGEVGQCTECEQTKVIVVRLFKSIPQFANPVTVALCRECAEKVGEVAWGTDRVCKLCRAVYLSK